MGWAKSPDRKAEEDTDFNSEVESMELGSPKFKEKKKKKKSKKEKKSKKKKKKSKKKKAKSSSSDSSEDEWVEKDVMESVAEGRRNQSDESDDDIIGPVLPQRGSKSQEILQQTVKNFSSCEGAITSTENNLEKLQVVVAQLQNQQQTVELSCDKISQVRAQVRDMQRWIMGRRDSSSEERSRSRDRRSRKER